MVSRMQSREQMDSVQLYLWIIEQYTVPAGVNKALLHHLSACSLGTALSMEMRSVASPSGQNNSETYAYTIILLKFSLPAFKLLLTDQLSSNLQKKKD